MTKGIIIADIPEKCGKCFCFKKTNINSWCEATKNHTYNNSLPKWCPIKPIPEKDNSDASGIIYDEYPLGYRDGWNACIEAMIGGTEC